MATRGREPSCRDVQCDATVPVPGDVCPRCGALQRSTGPSGGAAESHDCSTELPGSGRPAHGSEEVADEPDPDDHARDESDQVEARAGPASDPDAGQDGEVDAGEWTPVVRDLLDRPYHDEIEVPKAELPDPAEHGFDAAHGKPVGQLADYRLVLEDGGCVHVREFEDRYAAHRDRVAPSVSRLGHLWYDMPVETSAVAAFLAVALVRRAAPPTVGVARRAALAVSSALGRY